jgi:hypothetical protein
MGITALSDLVEFRLKCCTASPPKLRIFIHSDNFATVSWLNSRTPPKSSKAVEQRSIARLVSAIDDELNLLQKHAVVKVVHVAGEDNCRADYLSRLYSRPCSVVGQRVLTLREVLADSNYKEKKDSVAVDKVNLILEDFSTASYSSNIVEY